MADNKLKHLEFLQNVITRMNTNSFLIKGWAITITSAIYALAAKDANPEYIGVTYLSCIIFWALDSYYLSQERKFRGLYDEVSAKNEDQINFSMNTSTFNSGDYSWGCSFFSKTIWPIYSIVIIISLLVMFVFKK